MSSDDKKFMFNVHIFDEPETIEPEEEEEDLPPPPPTFSEEELEAAKSMSFEQGRQEGRAEETESREATIKQILERIANDYGTLYAQEQEREKLFEEETVKLSMKIFEYLYPQYSQEHGFEELKLVILNILETQKNQSEITIEVNPDFVPAIQTAIDTTKTAAQKDTKFNIIGAEQLPPSECRLTWKNGGAIYNMDKIAQEIRDEIQEMLAARTLNPHDGSDKNVSAPTSTEQEDHDSVTNEELEALAGHADETDLKGESLNE